MPLAPGSKLGQYEVVAAIGAGGMGEVYRARDTKLKRDVALKVLPEAFARDPSRMTRFQREAELLASLNHPNIAAIYGVEERALVMELVVGDNLPCPLPVDTALHYARQIAEALEYAHERGVIHRDLKPANIKVTAEGTVKLLDFGLAKAIEDPGGVGEDPSNSPTLTLGATRMGVILGTAAYMSPEQAGGKTADRRADIWSFGAVLYEMLSGQKAFPGESASDTLATVLKLEPDWNALPAATPAAIRKLVRRCLAKDRKQRLQAIGEARIALDEAIKGVPPDEAAAVPARRRPVLPWAVAAVAVGVAGVALWGWLRTAPPAPRPVTRFAVQLPSAPGFAPLAVSRDGSRVAFEMGPGRPIYLRQLDELEARPVPGTESGEFPCFSPDGQWIAYLTPPPGQLRKIPVGGGAALTLVEGLNGALPMSWGADGNILFTGTEGLLRVPASGGKPQVLVTSDPKKGEVAYAAPQLLPGGKQILFSILGSRGLNEAQVAAFNLETHEKKILLEGAGTAWYAATGIASGAGPGSGYLVYGHNTSLFAVPFEVKGLKVGAPAPVLEGVSGVGALVVFGLSDSGTLAYLPGNQASLRAASTLVWVDRQGVEQPVSAPPRVYQDMRLSPDGGRVAFDIVDLQQLTADVWVYDFARGALTRLTFEGINQDPVWTPDGKRLIYISNRNLTSTQGMELRSVPSDSSGAPTKLLASEGPHFPGSVSPDGKLVAGTRSRSGGPAGTATSGSDLWMLPLPDGSPAAAKPQTFLESPFAKGDPQFSPDGKWVAYQSNETVRNEVYVVPYPGPGGKSQVSIDGGTAPRWARTGRELFYRNGNKLMAVDIETTPAFRAGTPKMLFEKPSIGYDVAPDGKRFLLNREGAAAPGQQAEVHVVVNWFEELRRRVTAGK